MKTKTFKRTVALVAAVCLGMSNTTHAESISPNQISQISHSNLSPDETENQRDTYVEDGSVQPFEYNDVSKQPVPQNDYAKQTVSGNIISIQTVSHNDLIYDDGKYLVYVEDEKQEEVVEEIMDEASLVEEQTMEEATLYVADLSAEQAEELAQEENVYVEENIELAASQTKNKSRIPTNSSRK